MQKSSKWGNLIRNPVYNKKMFLAGVGFGALDKLNFHFEECQSHFYGRVGERNLQFVNVLLFKNLT